MSLRWFRLALFVVVLASAGGCVSPRSHAPSLTPEEAVEATNFWKSVTQDRREACRACMSDPAGACETLDRFPLVAVAQGIVVTKEVSPCSHLRNPHPGDEIECVRFAVFRFEHFDVLQGDPELERRASFRTLNEYDYWMPEKKSGVDIKKDGRYLIFAQPASESIPLKADWDVTVACPIS